MIPRDLFLELGGFDEAYAPAYFEDCDLAFASAPRAARSSTCRAPWSFTT